MRDVMPLLVVDDVGKTVQYYVHKLGFGVEAQWPGEGAPVAAVVKYKNVKFMFESKEAYARHSGHLLTDEPRGVGVELHVLVTDGVGGYHAELKVMEGVDIIRHIATNTYGVRQFTIRDLNGYIITFEQYCRDGN